MVFFKECLRVRTFHKGEDDVEVAEVFLAIGLLYEKKRQYVEALVNLEECLRIRKTKMGDARGKLEVTQTLQNMGIILGNSRDYKQSCWDVEGIDENVLRGWTQWKRQSRYIN